MTDQAFLLSPSTIAHMRALQGVGMESSVGEYTPPEFWPLLDYAEALMQARKAWRDKLAAESTLLRLGRYARMTAGMKDDRRRALDLLSTAEADLRRLLGGAA